MIIHKIILKSGKVYLKIQEKLSVLLCNNFIKEMKFCPCLTVPVERASTCRLKGSGFDPGGGHMPGFWA